MLDHFTALPASPELDLLSILRSRWTRDRAGSSRARKEPIGLFQNALRDLDFSSSIDLCPSIARRFKNRGSPSLFPPPPPPAPFVLDAETIARVAADIAAAMGGCPLGEATRALLVAKARQDAVRGVGGDGVCDLGGVAQVLADDPGGPPARPARDVQASTPLQADRQRTAMGGHSRVCGA